MEILLLTFLGKPIWMWLLFLTIIIVLLAFDLGVLHKEDHEVGVQESITLSAFYITLGLGFGGFVWFYLGMQSGKEYLTGFIIEKTLAIDNIFVISLIFSYLGIPRIYQHRVLFWGILGVIVLRAIMIGLGAALVSEFSWVLYIFAVFLIFTGIKMIVISEQEPDIENNPILKYIRNHFPVTKKLYGHDFWVKLKDKKTKKFVWHMTPLMVALILIECADLIFAVDSVPAIFAVTTDPYIVYTSNIFAILGLRALYFCLAVIIHRFRYLKQALALVLIFIGSKIFLADVFGQEKFPTSVSLFVTFVLLSGGIIFSLYKTRKEEKLEN